MSTNKRKIRKRKKTQQNIGFTPTVWFIALVFMLIIPLIHVSTTLDPVMYPRFLAMGTGLFLLTLIFAQIVKRNPPNVDFLRDPVFILFGIYILITLVALLMATNPVEGITDLLKWIMAGLLVLFATFLFRAEPNTIIILSKTAAISALIACLIGIYQYFNFSVNSDDP
ncbi:MAG: hypothetical protein KDC05_17400, partial [Bacteroidales bacterium]|nr:hypothetical protein [Bacteroidales bacterium]